MAARFILRTIPSLRFHTRIPRDSDRYKAIYKERTACERVNNIRDLADVRCLVNQAANVDRKPASILIVRLFAEQVEELAVDHCQEEIEGGVGIAHDEEQGRFLVPQGIQTQLIISGNLPKFGNIKRCKPGSAGNQY